MMEETSKRNYEFKSHPVVKEKIIPGKKCIPPGNSYGRGN